MNEQIMKVSLGKEFVKGEDRLSCRLVSAEAVL